MSALILVQRLLTHKQAHTLSTQHINDLKFLNMKRDVFVIVNNGKNNYSEYSRHLYAEHNIHYVENDKWHTGFGFEFGAWKCGLSYLKALSLDARIFNYYFLQDSVCLTRLLPVSPLPLPMCFAFPSCCTDGKNAKNQ